MSNAHWQLRPLTAADDLAQLTALIRAAYAPHLAAGLRFVGTHQTVDVTRSRISEGDCFVATEGATLVGTVLARPPQPHSRAPLYRDPHTWSIGQLAVDPARKGRGLGRALHDFAAAHAARRGARTLALDTAAPARGLIALYEGWGYRIVGSVDWRPDTNYESVLMAKAIDPTRANN